MPHFVFRPGNEITEPVDCSDDEESNDMEPSKHRDARSTRLGKMVSLCANSMALFRYIGFRNARSENPKSPGL